MKQLSDLFQGIAAIGTSISILAIIGLTYVLFIWFPKEPNEIYVYQYLSVVNIVFYLAMVLLFLLCLAIMKRNFEEGENPLKGLVKLILPIILALILGIGLTVNDYKGLDKKYGDSHSIFNPKK